MFLISAFGVVGQEARDQAVGAGPGVDAEEVGEGLQERARRERMRIGEIDLAQGDDDDPAVLDDRAVVVQAPVLDLHRVGLGLLGKGASCSTSWPIRK